MDCCLYLDCISLFSFVLMVPAIPHQVNMSSADLFPTIWFYSLFYFICFHFNYLSTGWKIAAWWGIRIKGEICVQVAQSWPHSLAYLLVWFLSWKLINFYFYMCSCFWHSGLCVLIVPNIRTYSFFFLTYVFLSIGTAVLITRCR